MDYNNFCDNIRRIKNTLEKYHREEEATYNANIRFLEELMDSANYKKITMNNREFLLEVLSKKQDTTRTESKEIYSKYANNSTYGSTDINRQKTESVEIINDKINDNKAEHNSEEETSIRDFIENYNSGKLSSLYEVLAVSDEWADKLTTMDLSDWKRFADKDRISLKRGNSARAKYFAYKAMSNKPVYFLVPADSAKENFGGIKVFQNAFPTFFDFNLDECENNTMSAIVIKPAIVIKDDNEFKLYIDKNGKKYQGVIEFR